MRFLADRRQTKELCRVVFIAAIVVGLAAQAEPPRVSVRRTLERAWDDLSKSEPAATRALLCMSATPLETAAFLKERLKPLTLSNQDLDEKLKQLASPDAATWRAAFAYLEYFDPRVNADLFTLMDRVPDNPARCRLVALLSDRPAEEFTDKVIELRSTNDGANFFIKDVGSWWAESRVDRLLSGAWNRKRLWTRAVRAVVLLQRLDTPDARAVVAAMASGNADAVPTKVAKDPTYDAEER